MYTKIIPTEGEKIGHVTFIKEVERIKKGGILRRHGLFRCECGKEDVKILSQVFGSGKVRSCGECEFGYVIPDNKGKKSGKYKHGLYGTRFYDIYYGIKARCKDKNNIWYYNKKVEWGTFDDFKNDMYRSYLEHVKIHGEKQTTIDRINPFGDYSTDNCRWATFNTQENNRKDNVFFEIGGNILTMAQWRRQLNMNEYQFKKKVKEEKLKKYTALQALSFKMA